MHTQLCPCYRTMARLSRQGFIITVVHADDSAGAGLGVVCIGCQTRYIWRPAQVEHLDHLALTLAFGERVDNVRPLSRTA